VRKAQPNPAATQWLARLARLALESDDLQRHDLQLAAADDPVAAAAWESGLEAYEPLRRADHYESVCDCW
jgi:hypothetical protein